VDLDGQSQATKVPRLPRLPPPTFAWVDLDGQSQATKVPRLPRYYSSLALQLQEPSS